MKKTCSEIIKIVNNARVNRCSDEQKLLWINELDRKVNAELFPSIEFTEHTMSDEVLADNSTIYVTYLLAQLDFYLGEFERYNNEYLRFTQEYQDYGATVIRTNGRESVKIKW